MSTKPTAGPDTAISLSKRASKRWSEEHPAARGDPQVFRETILPGLATLKLAEIMAACGVSKATASKVRSGKQIPALRHWGPLQMLAERSA